VSIHQFFIALHGEIIVQEKEIEKRVKKELEERMDSDEQKSQDGIHDFRESYGRNIPSNRAYEGAFPKIEVLQDNPKKIRIYGIEAEVPKCQFKTNIDPSQMSVITAGKSSDFLPSQPYCFRIGFYISRPKKPESGIKAFIKKLGGFKTLAYPIHYFTIPTGPESTSFLSQFNISADSLKEKLKIWVHLHPLIERFCNKHYNKEGKLLPKHLEIKYSGVSLPSESKILEEYKTTPTSDLWICVPSRWKVSFPIESNIVGKIVPTTSPYLLYYKEEQDIPYMEYHLKLGENFLENQAVNFITVTSDKAIKAEINPRNLNVLRLTKKLAGYAGLLALFIQICWPLDFRIIIELLILYVGGILIISSSRLMDYLKPQKYLD